MKSDELKTALKLVNKYAESYTLLEAENKHLQAEILDMKMNLRINKEIITGLFQYNKDERSSFYANKLREEISSLQNQNEKFEKENEVLKTQLSNTEQIMNVELTREKDTNERLTNKLFLLENILIKKDGLIKGYNKKITKIHQQTYLQIDSSTKVNEREIFIVEPSLAINSIHDELEMYKNIYNNLIPFIKELKATLNRYQELNQDLEVKIGKLIKENKLKGMNLNLLKTADNLNNTPNTPKTVFNMNLHREEDKEYLKTDNRSNNKTTNNSVFDITNNKSTLKLSILKQYETYEEHNRKDKEAVNLAEEWGDTLKHCGMTQDEFVQFSKMKSMSKLVDALEFLYKLLVDKNSQIRILLFEIEDLNLKNLTLNKDNMALYEQVSGFSKDQRKSDCKSCKQITNNNFNIVITKGDKKDSSMFNNTSNPNVNEKDDTLNMIKSLNKNKTNSLRTHNNERYMRTNTLESITASEFAQGITNNSFLSSANNSVDNVADLIDVQHIKHV